MREDEGGCGDNKAAPGRTEGVAAGDGAGGATLVFEGTITRPSGGPLFRGGPSGSFGANDPETVSRRALLFRAGDYPDKNVTVTIADLDLIVARFAQDRVAVAGGAIVAPVKAEHRDSALDPLGETVALYRRGDALYGLLTFGRGMDAHLQERGAMALSVALVREPEARGGGFRLKEVSVVLTPRVAGAGFVAEEEDEAAHEARPVSDINGGDVLAPMDAAGARGLGFGGGGADGPRFPFSPGVGAGQSVSLMATAAAFAQNNGGDADKNAASGEGQAETTPRPLPPQRATPPPPTPTTGETLVRLRASGRLTPAMEPHARALLSLASLLPPLADGVSAPPTPASPPLAAVRFAASANENNGDGAKDSASDAGANAALLGETVAFHVAGLLDALPPVQPRAPVLGFTVTGAGGAFRGFSGAGNENPVPETVRQVAESVGADARRVWREMTGQGQG